MNTVTSSGDTCPRCGQRFNCGVDDTTAPCPCTALHLTPSLLADLSERYQGCLCLRCLAELAGAAEKQTLNAARGAESS